MPVVDCAPLREMGHAACNGELVILGGDAVLAQAPVATRRRTPMAARRDARSRPTTGMQMGTNGGPTAIAH